MKPLILVGLMLAIPAHADVTMDDDKGNTTFRVQGQVVDAAAATKAAISGAKVYRCKPKAITGKKVWFSGGNATTEVVECTPVELVITPKSGDPKWKVIK